MNLRLTVASFGVMALSLVACGSSPTSTQTQTATDKPIERAQPTEKPGPPQPSGILASVCRDYQAQVRNALDASDYGANHPDASLFDIPAALRYALQSVEPPIALVVAHNELIAYIDDMAEAFEAAKAEMSGTGSLMELLERATKVIDEFNNAPNAHLDTANRLFAFECGFDLTTAD